MCLMLFSALSSALANEAKYKDLPETHWAYKAVQALAKTGTMKGFPDQTFRPNLKVTREQFATVLVLSLKIPTDHKAPQTFSDVKPDHRSFLYIDAAKFFIPTPTNSRGPFNYNGQMPITREEVAESIVLASGLKKHPKANIAYLQNNFKDFANISPAFREQVALAVYYGIMSGNANGTFDSKGALTRAELAVIVQKLLQEIQINQAPPKPIPPETPPHLIIEPQYKPWTLRFITPRPDYAETMTFTGVVAAKANDSKNFYMVLENITAAYVGSTVYADVKTVNMYVYREDYKWFTVSDRLRINYDQDNNITAYVFESRVSSDKFLPPIRR